MKKVLFIIAMSTFTGSIMAQNSVINKAREIFDTQTAVNELYKDENGQKATRVVLKWDKLEEVQNILNPVFTYEKKQDIAKAWDLQSDINQRYLSYELNKAASKEELDTLKFFTYLNKTIESLYQTIKVDDKGQYKSKSELKMQQFRRYYTYAGQFFSTNQNHEKAFEAFDKWLSFPQTYSNLGNDIITKSEDGVDPSMIAYYASLTAYQGKMFDKLFKWKDLAMQYEKEKNNVIQLYLIATLENGDTVAWEKMSTDIALSEEPNVAVTQNLLAHYFNTENKVKASELAKNLCEKHPNEKIGPYALGLIAMQADKNDEAIEYFKKALSIDPDYIDALFNTAVCYYNNAMLINDAIIGKTVTKTENDKVIAKVRTIISEGLPYLEHIQELVPDKPERWARRLSNFYYILDKKDKYEEMKVYLD